jgi:hypothetical protein
MVLQRLKSANFLSHSEFLAFANEYYIEISVLTGSDKPKLIERIRGELTGFASCLKELQLNNLWEHIDTLEKKKYSLWETIVDKLDDNLNIAISDNYLVLEKINLTLETACREVPSYAASFDLVFPEGTSQLRFFQSQRHALGHYWTPELMNKLVTHLIDPQYLNLCEAAGVATDVICLSEIEQQLAMMIDLSEITPTLEKIRKYRYLLCLGMYVSFRRSTDKVQKYKTPVWVDASICFQERFVQLGELERMEKCSVDLLPFSIFFSLVENTARKLFEKRPDSVIYEDYQTDLPVLLKCYNAFCSHILWEQFEKEDNAFYKELLLLLDKVTGYTSCYNGVNEEIWEKFTRSATYNAACTLLDECNSETVSAPDDTDGDGESSTSGRIHWRPGDPVDFYGIKKIVRYWGTTTNRKHLSTLNSLELFEHCMALNATASDTASVIKSMNPDADLDTLRKYRYFMGLFLAVVPYELK